jgi:mevalonate kinase
VSAVREAAGSAPAKAILLGEHFVVHGGPAVALPVPALRVTVRLRAGAPDAARDAARHATRGAGVDARGDACGDAAPSHLAACLTVCERTLGPLPGGPPAGAVSAAAEGDLPLSAGLGSSAALAIATARAWCALAGRPADGAALRAAADACEQLAHGRPSGVDVATVLAPGPLRFRRGEAPRPLPVVPGIGLLVLDSGTQGETARTVAAVVARREREPAAFAAHAAAVAGLVEAGAAALAAGDATALGAALNANHTVLAAIGVSTAALDALVAAARRAGAAGAKLTGGGGGGCVLAACPVAALDALAARLAADGVRVLATLRPGEEARPGHEPGHEHGHEHGPGHGPGHGHGDGELEP